MFEHSGQNNFNSRFNFTKWSAPYYENPQEVFDALDGMKLIGKKIVAINAMGSCLDAGQTNGIGLSKIVKNAGYPIYDIEDWYQKYPYMDDVLVPWNITTSEPIQITFDDGIAVEIRPMEKVEQGLG